MIDYVGHNIFKLDANAPKGLDNLSKPSGVIKDAQNLMAEAFGADSAYFLTNGTTQGILAVIMSACRARHKINTIPGVQFDQIRVSGTRNLEAPFVKWIHKVQTIRD